MNIALSAIQRDTSIQTRAEINMETVNSYAEAMTEGAKFPPVVLFGTEGKCWIGDGWHRVMAAEQIDAMDIPAELRDGGRVDALKHALGANAVHGQRRTNADKRRCVELAIKEFASLSSRAIAELCGVSKTFVENIRPSEVATVATCRTGADGKQYPATRRTSKPATPEEEEAMYFEKEEKERKQADTGNAKQKPIKRGRPCNGMQFARMAVLDLEQITDDDTERVEAFEFVKEWINENYESKNTKND